MSAEKTYIIDRIEGDIAVCECTQTGERLKFNTKNLPCDIKEGDVIRKDTENIFAIDIAQSKQRMANLTSRMNSLFKSD